MTMDTRTVTLNQDDFSLPNCAEEFDFSATHVEFIVTKAFSNTDLELTIPMEFRNYGMAEVVAGTPFSKVAYIESEQGYFIVSEDMMQHINISYSRWD